EDGRMVIRQIGLGAMTRNSPIWAVDGGAIFYAALQPSRDGPLAYDIFQSSRTGTGAGERVRLLHTFENKIPVDAFGNFVLFAQSSKTTFDDLFALPLEAGSEPIPVVATPAREKNGRFSPDGRWVAYESDEVAGHDEVF